MLSDVLHTLWIIYIIIEASYPMLQRIEVNLMFLLVVHKGKQLNYKIIKNPNYIIMKLTRHP